MAGRRHGTDDALDRPARARGRSIIAGRDARLLRWDMPPAAPREIYRLPGLVHYAACSQSGEMLAIAYDDARFLLAHQSRFD